MAVRLRTTKRYVGYSGLQSKHEAITKQRMQFATMQVNVYIWGPKFYGKEKYWSSCGRFPS